MTSLISRNEQGHPFSPLFEDIYASGDGAYGQAIHVFLKGNGLPERWQAKSSFTILENGFGLGTNFLATLKAWREDPQRSKKLNYVAIEKFPLTAQELVEYCDPHLKNLAIELSQKWPQRTPGIHRIDFDDGQVALTLFFADAEKAAKNLTGQFNAFYLDGFSPVKNPEMWQKRIFNEFAKHACPGATLATWCVASEVRKTLHSVGFDVKKEKGFGHKAEMTIGVFAPHWKHSRAHADCPVDIPPEERDVLVVGAGVAGAAVACEFRSRGWKVSVVDSAALPAASASAIRWGLIHAQFAPDDNFLFRLTRAGLEATRRKLKEFPELADLKGLFQVARSDEEALKWNEWFHDAASKGVPEDFMSFHPNGSTSSLVGREMLRGGIFHENAGLVALGQWVRKRLEKAGVDLRLNQTVESLKYENGKWQAIGSFGEVITQASYCVLAAGADTAKLALNRLPITRWTGRISLLVGKEIEDFKGGAVTGPGYLIVKDGLVGVGATYENMDTGERLSDIDAHLQNLTKLEKILGSVDEVTACGFYEGVRAVSPDRMPYVGKLSIESDNSSWSKDKLYVSCAFGSRGAVLADVAAQVISGMVYGEPLPLEKDLIDAIAPERFGLKANVSNILLA